MGGGTWGSSEVGVRGVRCQWQHLGGEQKDYRCCSAARRGGKESNGRVSGGEEAWTGPDVQGRHRPDLCMGQGSVAKARSAERDEGGVERGKEEDGGGTKVLD